MYGIEMLLKILYEVVVTPKLERVKYNLPKFKKNHKYLIHNPHNLSP